MARTNINFRTWIALILLGVLAIVFASLGNWQLNRAAQRDAIHAQIRDAAQIQPVTLTGNTAETELIPWRRARAQGYWLHQYTVLLENRNHQSRPGYWVATPLQLLASIDSPAVLVLRGWLARDDVIEPAASGAAKPDPALAHWLAQPTGPQTVTGELFPHVPRLLELWSLSGRDSSHLPDMQGGTHDQLPAVQNLPLADYARTTGLQLVPIILAADSSEPTMVQDWPHPSSDSDTNRGYALQWFAFCVISAGAWLFIAWRAIKSFF